MRDVHPFLVLSPRIFNAKTSLVIGLSMTTSAYNADNPFAVPVGKTSTRKAGRASYVLCHQPKSFDWRLRHAKAHPLGALSNALFAQVCERLNQIISLTLSPSPPQGGRRQTLALRAVLAQPEGRGKTSPSPSGTAEGSLRSSGEPTGVPLAGVRVGMREK